MVNKKGEQQQQQQRHKYVEQVGVNAPRLQRANPPRDAQNRNAQRPVELFHKHLLDVAFKPDVGREVGREVVFPLHVAPRTEQRLENHPHRLGKTGGRVFHLRRQTGLAAGPGRPPPRPGLPRENQPESQRDGQKTNRRQHQAERGDGAGIFRQRRERQTVGQAELPADLLADELLGQRIQQTDEGGREKSEQHAGRGQHAPCPGAWRARPRRRWRHVRCGVGPGK